MFRVDTLSPRDRLVSRGLILSPEKLLNLIRPCAASLVEDLRRGQEDHVDLPPDAHLGLRRLSLFCANPAPLLARQLHCP